MNTYKRLCPNCKEERIYKNIVSFKKAEKLNRNCIKCVRKEVSNRPEERLKNSERQKGKFIGEKNPMFGKRHSKEKQKQINNNLKKYYEKNPGTMTGKTFYDCWIKKYGKEEADKKLISFKKKQSINNSGEKNPMFGKPSPQGSGNGWSGWYKNHFFRSLLELSFMIENDPKWKSAENNKYKIPYIIDDKKKNYFPDFIIDNVIYEIKPLKLYNTKENSIKFEEAKRWCYINGFEFKLITPKKIEYYLLNKLVIEEIVIFTEKYKKKYKLWNEKINLS